MTRHRWLKAQWPISMRVLAKRLKLRAFADQQSEGFVIDRVRDDFLQARFVEKFEFNETVIDPFGVESSFPRIEYRQCEFMASSHGPGLELLNAPRSVQVMISRLAEATEFSLAISPMSIDVLTWAVEVQRSLATVGVVDLIQVGAIDLSRGVQAKIVIKGSADVLVAANQLVEGRRHVVEKVQLRLVGQRKTTVLLTNVGIAHFEPEPSEEVLDAVRSSVKILS